MMLVKDRDKAQNEINIILVTHRNLRAATRRHIEEQKKQVFFIEMEIELRLKDTK